MTRIESLNFPYPQGNFVTHQLPGEVDLPLEVHDSYHPDLMRALFPNENKESEYFQDYILTPHIYIPRYKLWISDGHKYVVPMAKILEAMGKPTRKILSIDLDYFLDLTDLQAKTLELLQATCVASNYTDLVIADFHEDLPRMSWGYKPPGDLTQTVELINSGKIADDNFIPYLGIHQPWIIKPPTLRHAPSFRESETLVVTNAEQILGMNNQDSCPKLLDCFDLIHVCTSPTYIDPSIALIALQMVYEQCKMSP